MRTPTTFRVITAAMLLALAGCGSTALTPESRPDDYVPPPVPANYRELIVRDIKAVPATARGIIEPEISTPGVGLVGRLPEALQFTKATTVCVRFFTPDVLAAAGILDGATEHRRVYWFANGQLRVDNIHRDIYHWNLQCRGERRFEPFSELPSLPGVQMRKKQLLGPAGGFVLRR